MKKTTTILLITLIAGTLALTACKNENNSNPQEKTTATVTGEIFTGEKIDEIKTLAKSVTLSDKIIENKSLGIKATCPKGEDWECTNNEKYSNIKMVWKEGMGVILISKKDYPSLKEAYKSEIDFNLSSDTNTQEDEKIEDSSITAIIKYAANIQEYKELKELAPGKLIMCSGQPQFKAEDFENLKAEIAAVCATISTL